MAGSPIKGARRMGVVIPPLGNGAGHGGPARGDWPTQGSRAREPNPVPPDHVPPDEELVRIAKGALLEIVLHGGGPESNARVGAARTLIDASWTPQDVFFESIGGHEEAIQWILKNADRLALAAAERGLEPPKLAKILADKKKSARELLRSVQAAMPRLQQDAAEEAMAAGEPWPPPEEAKDDGQW